MNLFEDIGTLPLFEPLKPPLFHKNSLFPTKPFSFVILTSYDDLAPKWEQNIHKRRARS